MGLASGARGGETTGVFVAAQARHADSAQISSPRSRLTAGDVGLALRLGGSGLIVEPALLTATTHTASAIVAMVAECIPSLPGGFSEPLHLDI